MRPYCSSKLAFRTILYAAFLIESATAAGGIFGLKALTGNMPYIGFGNPWITYPRIAHGGAGLYSPYSLWRYGGISGGYGNAGIYNPYQTYLFNQFGSQPLTTSSRLSNLLTTTSLSGGGGGYYRGRGNPWITQ